MKQVLHDRRSFSDYDLIHNIRKSLMNNTMLITVNTYGAVTNDKIKLREVREIVKRSSVSDKHGKLLYRLAKHFKPDLILELGTSVGLSTLYLSTGYRNAKVYTVEGNRLLSDFAAEIFRSINLENIHVMHCKFEDALQQLSDIDLHNILVFIDGNHTYDATMAYFGHLIGRATGPFIMVFHDINWSDEMNRAWKEIQADQRVKTTFNLYNMGIVYNFMGSQKQNIALWY